MPFIRSFLFVPGNQERKLAKAYSTAADAVILDLEDAVPPGEKARARQLVREFLQKTDRIVPTFARINSVGSGLAQDDLREIVPTRIEGIVLSKVDTPDDLREVESYLLQLEAEHDLNHGHVELLPFIESARGIMKAYEIASASPRVRRLAFGGVDYVLDLGCELTVSGEEVAYARSTLVVVSRAAGLEPPVDTVFPHFRDLGGLAEHARRARQLGMGGKLLIHPDQVGPVNDVFSPTPAELAWAHRIVALYEEAEAQGLGAVQLEGSMVELPVAERARQMIALAGSIGLRTDEGGGDR